MAQFILRTQSLWTKSSRSRRLLATLPRKPLCQASQVYQDEKNDLFSYSVRLKHHPILQGLDIRMKLAYTATFHLSRTSKMFSASSKRKILMDLPLQASQYVTDGQVEPSTSSSRLQAVVEAAKSGLTLVDLVKNLREYLIAEDGDTRARATLLLAKVRPTVSRSFRSPCWKPTSSEHSYTLCLTTCRCRFCSRFQAPSKGSQTPVTWQHFSQHACPTGTISASPKMA